MMNVTQKIPMAFYHIFKISLHVACYLPTQDEFDTAAIIEAIWHANKQCYLPVLCDEKDKFLQFVKYQYGDSLRRNKYKILEPTNLSRKIIASELDLVITPLLAFDLHGHRLGTGGGYYDRTFAFLRDAVIRKPFMLGLGYTVQQTESLPAEEWDIRLDAVLTEKGTFVE